MGLYEALILIGATTGFIALLVTLVHLYEHKTKIK